MVETDAQGVAQAEPAPRQGEPCEECGAPLAADQRYCLNCGRRRGGPRVDYRHYMGAATQLQETGADEPAQPAAEAGPAKAQRDYAPLAAVGGIAVLGLMLLVGVLIGKGNSDTPAAPAQQVIRVPAAEAESSGSEGGGSSRNTAGGKLGGGGAKKAKHNAAGNSPGTGSAVHASESDLQELSSESGSDYEKQSKELPNEIATPGAPPPVDKSKPPGGGEGGGEVIK